MEAEHTGLWPQEGHSSFAHQRFLLLTSPTSSSSAPSAATCRERESQYITGLALCLAASDLLRRRRPAQSRAHSLWDLLLLRSPARPCTPTRRTSPRRRRLLGLCRRQRHALRPQLLLQRRGVPRRVHRFVGAIPLDQQDTLRDQAQLEQRFFAPRPALQTGRRAALDWAVIRRRDDFRLVRVWCLFGWGGDGMFGVLRARRLPWS